MIQGGDFTNKNGIGDQYHPDLTHIRGALAYAKTSEPNSIGSQFYIVHPQKGAHFLDHTANGGPAQGYTVFGQMYEGFEVLDAIATTKTRPDDCPVVPQIVKDIVIETLA